MNNTIVTGIWDIKRESLSEGWNRNFDHYLNNLEKLLKTDDNMIIYIEGKYSDWVWERRTKENTMVIIRELDWFKNNTDMYDKIKSIRNNPNWYNQSGWLVDSTQAKLEMYNPIVMSKMFLLNDASILDPFNSTHMIWVDGGITNTVNEGYFWKDKVISKIDKYFNKFSFVSFPYDGKVEIHGFDYNAMCNYSNSDVDKVCRGGIFGGPKSSISEINSIYYNLLMDTLINGYMGTEESLFTIMLYSYPQIFQYYEINGDGLLNKFFEDLKNDNLKVKFLRENNKISYNELKTSLYVLTYNSPKQFETLLTTFGDVDNNFLEKPRKILINNSTDRTTDEDYKNLCEKYGFEEIKKDNIGICGGRQLVAEHFEDSDSDYYIFFEDDMNLHHKTSNVCKSGFMRYKENLFEKSLKIIHENNYDYLKLSFSEFYGDNSVQWAWYNVPQNIRDKFFPEKNKLPIMGLDPNPPKTSYKEIKCLDDLPYVEGEVHYCNWPLWMGKEGNKKVFINTKWQSPQEQTWMSFVYQLQKEGVIKSGILLLSPIDHERFDFYPATERREN
jgi:hypothetical protein